MKKYFTKEYIKECSCGEIKKLRPQLDVYDFCILNNSLEDYSFENGLLKEFILTTYEGIVKRLSPNFTREDLIYIPTGDQLDEEIIKILKDKYEYYKWEYIIKCCWIGRSHTNWSCTLYDENHGDMFTEIDSNPLIAKIKLLKQLLK